MKTKITKQLQIQYGKKIKKARREAGVSINEMVVFFGYAGPCNISKAENGKCVGGPSERLVYKYLEAIREIKRIKTERNRISILKEWRDELLINKEKGQLLESIEFLLKILKIKKRPVRSPGELELNFRKQEGR